MFGRGFESLHLHKDNPLILGYSSISGFRVSYGLFRMGYNG